MTQQEQFVPDPEVGRLYDEEGLTVQQVADRLGMSTYFATKHLKALDVPIRGAAPEAPFVPDPEVARLYKGEALNVGEVGARLDMSSHLVRKHLKALKVPMRRGPATPDLPWDEIAEEYKDGASTVQLGEKYGVHQTTIYNRLKPLGVLRTVVEATEVHQSRPLLAHGSVKGLANDIGVEPNRLRALLIEHGFLVHPAGQ